MAEINESVYGARENWYVPGSRTELGHQYSGDAYYYNDIAADDKLKIKVANFNTLSNPVTSFCSQIDGQYTSENYLIRNNWTPTQTDSIDRSIVQFGIGPQSGLADIEWWGVEWITGQSEPTTSVDPTILNHDKYDIVNIGLGLDGDYTPPMNYTAGSAANTTTGDMLITGEQYINRQIWGDQRSYFSTDSDSFYRYHVASGYAFLNFITQIPIKNLKLYPRITAYKSDTQWKQFNSIQDYLAEKNDYPLLGCIEAMFQYRSGLNNTTDYNSSVGIKPIFTDKTTVLKGYQNGTGEDQVIRDENLWYYRSWRSHFVIAGRYGYDQSGPNGMMNDIYWVPTYDSRSYTYAIFDAVYQTPDFKFTLNENKCFTCDTSSMTDDQITEGIRTQLASFGMFFVDDIDDINLALDDDKTFLGILENGVGYGKYSHGKKNREQDQWNWDTMEENDYDPKNPPSPPGPEPDPNPIIPDTPGFSLAVGNGSVCYTITKSEWAQIWDNIYGGSKKNWKALIEGLALYGSNPLNAILNYRWYPFYLGGTDTRPLRLGSTIVQPATNVYHCITSSKQAFTSAAGSFIWGRPKNFVNTRKTKARLYLPFYGFYDLPTSLLVNRELEVRFQYNLPDDNGVWFIMFGGSVYDYVECQPFIEIPITGDNSLQIAAAKAQRNLQIATTIGAAAIMAGATILGPTIGAAITAGSKAAWSTGGTVSGIAATIAQGAGRELITAPTVGAALTGAGALAGAGIKTANNIMQSAFKIGTLSTNVPIHGQASDTTFLHLPKYPYIQIYTNTLIDGYNESEYKWKVGIACDKWGNLASMPEQTLLATTGTANMGTDGMLIDEVKELNDILQSGFYR